MKKATMIINRGRVPANTAHGAPQTASGIIRTMTNATAGCNRMLMAGFFGAAMSISVILTGCANQQAALPVPADARVPNPDATLAAGDEVRITFPGAPDLNTQQRVQPDGRISLPTVGEITVAGKSTGGLQRQLKSLYQPHLQDSSVSVSLASSAAGVYVTGAVQRPGKIPLYRSMTAMEAVMEAGGFTPMSNPRQVSVLRTRKGVSRNHVIDLNQGLHNAESTPFYLSPYDVVYVPERLW